MKLTLFYSCYYSTHEKYKTDQEKKVQNTTNDKKISKIDGYGINMHLSTALLFAS